MTAQRVPLGWQVLLVVDDPDTELDRWAGGLTDPAAGVVAAAARPQRDPGNRAVYADLITATGRPAEHRLGVTPPQLRTLRPSAAPWLLAGVQDIVITHAHWLDPESVGPLVILAAAADARVWLVGQPPGPALRAALAAWTDPDMTLDWDQFRTTWAGRGRTVPPVEPADHTDTVIWPGPVPDDDPIVFRYRCAASPTLNLDAVARLLARGYAIADTDILPALPEPHLAGAKNLRPAAIVTARAAWAALTAPTDDHALAIIRGIQLRLLFHGWHLFLPAARVHAARHAAEPSAPARPYAVRDLEAAAALVLADAGVSDWQLSHFSLARADAMRRTLLEDVARRILTAQLAARRLDGAGPHDPLFADPRCVDRPQLHAKLTGEMTGPHRLLGCRWKDRHVCDFGTLTALRTDPVLRRACRLSAGEPIGAPQLPTRVALPMPDLDDRETLLYLAVHQYRPNLKPHLHSSNRYRAARLRLTELGLIAAASDGLLHAT